jgi:hypothetical protein
MFTNISRTAGGEVKLELSTSPDSLLILQTSMDLSTWTTFTGAALHYWLKWLKITL